MTIITKPLSGEKKGDKLEVPLVDNDQLATAPSIAEDAESGSNVVIMRTRARRVSTSTTLCLLLTSLLVVSVGIIGGKYLYDQYMGALMRRLPCNADSPLHCCAQFSLPEQYYGSASNPEEYVSGSQTNDLYKALAGGDDDRKSGNNREDVDDFSSLMARHFREDFEIDVDNEQYEKIDVPDFQDGRSGRFIHDFNTNITGIIDLTGNRCFVMPLNRGNVLPPRSLFDLIHKISGGYYKVDTQIVRETMRVVTPPLTDLKDVGSYIGKECEDRPVYQLEKSVGGVVKRSADLHVEAKFAQFSGNKITEIDIVNLEAAQEFENSQH